ncbi:hypothetical protein E2C01_046139 [Portunus trituberculatus]|uniref:Uncharacterized protein n=1 Tax=Portunus trituberculatus TaxID=210409 RepID=A0A5B7G3K8_PORTR|nr:hypothetical protein [Portunus trituberculatus]
MSTVISPCLCLCLHCNPPRPLDDADGDNDDVLTLLLPLLVHTCYRNTPRDLENLVYYAKYGGKSQLDGRGKLILMMSRAMGFTTSRSRLSCWPGACDVAGPVKYSLGRLYSVGNSTDLHFEPQIDKWLKVCLEKPVV